MHKDLPLPPLVRELLSIPEYSVKDKAWRWQRNIAKPSYANGRRCLYGKTTDRMHRTELSLHLSLENKLVPESW